jgi:hypothetical protein
MSEVWSNSGMIWGVFWMLLAFGTLYNALVAWAEREGYTEGYLSLVVAVGVAVTLGGFAILSIDAALLALVCFAASGTPMIIGSIWRYLRRRAEARKAMIEESKR